MYVAGQQHVGVNSTAKAPRLLGEIIESAPIVCLGVKAHGPVVAALNDVPRDAGDTQSRAAGHDWKAEFSFIFPSSHEINVVCPLLLRSTLRP